MIGIMMQKKQKLETKLFEQWRDHGSCSAITVERVARMCEYCERVLSQLSERFV